jgi:AraC-like DNA-binding protein
MLLRFPAEWARSTLGLLHQEMAADFCQLIAATGDQREVRRTLEPEDMAWCRAFMAPTLCTAARKLLEGSRMSEFFFRKLLAERRPLEHFCTRTRRIAQERVEKVRLALAHDLENPPSLESLARLCGCNPQYLSRTFSEVAGMTISQYLRRLRIERAAQLLASGRMNASEAALEVGYQSLSHFSQAFREERFDSQPVDALRPGTDEEDRMNRLPRTLCGASQLIRLIR